MAPTGKRGYGQRRTVVQLNDEERTQSFGFGYRPNDEDSAKPEGQHKAAGSNFYIIFIVFQILEA